MGKIVRALRRAPVAVLAASLIAVPNSYAQTSPIEAGTPTIQRVFRNHYHENKSLDVYIDGILAGLLKKNDRDRNGLDQQDIDTFQQERNTHWRWRMIGQAMTFDSNNDLTVTRAEIESSLFGSRTDQRKFIASLLRRFDANGDEAITFEEARNAPLEIGRDTVLQDLLSLDPNKDGVVTDEELRVLATLAYQSLVQEKELERQEATKPTIIPKSFFKSRPERKQKRCVVPDVPSGAELVVFGSYEGDAISSVSIGGPEQETNLIDVLIEPGTNPLYVILTSYESMVWRISGATDRLTNVVVSSSATALPRRSGENVGGKPSTSGVSGVDRKKVTVTSMSCPKNFHDAGAKRVTESIEQIFGRTPDAIFGSYSAQQVAVPSGDIEQIKKGSPPLPDGFDPVMWKEASHYWPAGLVDVAPKDVVAEERVETYDVLPSQMGLAQLVGSGAIERIGGNKFRLVRPIAHMPPGMGGAHSVLLFIAEGVPVPPGDPVHACVVQEGKEFKKLSRGPCFSY